MCPATHQIPEVRHNESETNHIMSHDQTCLELGCRTAQVLQEIPAELYAAGMVPDAEDEGVSLFLATSLQI